MRQAANIKDFHPPLLLPGITVNTSPTNFSPIRQLQLTTFNGANWYPERGGVERLRGDLARRGSP